MPFIENLDITHGLSDITPVLSSIKKARLVASGGRGDAFEVSLSLR